MATSDPREHRVLILAPTPKDSTTTARLLNGAGHACHICGITRLALAYNRHNSLRTLRLAMVACIR
jgi:hypothetical protein